MSFGVRFLLLLGGLGVLVPGCGSRTDLWALPVCTVEGETRVCQDACGEGTMRCEDGVWSVCEVPLVTEGCENSCGEGTRTCENDTWSECQVEPVEELCENVCGTGSRTCVDDEWSECHVDPVEQTCSSKCGEGTETCEDGEWSPCSAPQPLPPELTATVRDFLDTHPDFELGTEIGAEEGIVEQTLGDDDKPVYAAGPEGTESTSGPASFRQWYRDVDGVNETTSIELPLATSPNDERLYLYEGDDFFPIDGELLGNQGRVHNYHFTLEASGSFVYRGGERFTFSGDDDVWVFVNRQLVIDIGGLHEKMTEGVQLDAVADEIGLEVGEEYSLHIFFAERQTVDSNFNIETSIAGLGECP